MRKRELKTVITFHTTAQAIAMEAACKSRLIPGRLIPVPRQLSAGCGLAWAMSPELRRQIETLCHDQVIAIDNIYECEV